MDRIWQFGWHGAFAALFTMMFLGVAPQKVGAQSLSFDVFIRGFRVGEVKFESRDEGDQYKIQGVMGSRGFFGSFIATRYSGAVIGERVNGRYRPGVFRGRFDQRRQFAQVDITYENGGPVSVVRTPPRAAQPTDVDPSSLSNVLDPITATWVLLGDVAAKDLCAHNFRIFEGNRVSGVRLKNDANSPEDVVTCIGNYTRIAGFTPEQLNERTVFPFRLQYSEIKPNVWRVSRFAATTSWGTAQAVRRN